MRLHGKTAIITGAGRGLGRSVACAFSREGACVVICARAEDELKDTALEIRRLGRSCVIKRADVGNPKDVDALVQAALEAYRRVDILINNAAVQGPIGPVAEADDTAWVQTIQTNLLGTYLCIRRVLPDMIAARRGKIINLSGGGATSARPNFSAYAASKAAIVRLTETLAAEVAPFNVQVNAIAPGPLATRMQREICEAGPRAGGKETEEAQSSLEAGERCFERATELALFLGSDQSDGLTGKLISALHDDWENWNAEHLSRLISEPWLTLRRLDEFTVRPLIEQAHRRSASEPAALGELPGNFRLGYRRGLSDSHNP